MSKCLDFLNIKVLKIRQNLTLTTGKIWKGLLNEEKFWRFERKIIIKNQNEYFKNKPGNLIELSFLK